MARGRARVFKGYARVPSFRDGRCEKGLQPSEDGEALRKMHEIAMPRRVWKGALVRGIHNEPT